jgi:hypothetical protein
MIRAEYKQTNQKVYAATTRQPSSQRSIEQWFRETDASETVMELSAPRPIVTPVSGISNVAPFSGPRVPTSLGDMGGGPHLGKTAVHCTCCSSVFRGTNAGSGAALRYQAILSAAGGIDKLEDHVVAALVSRFAV